MRNDLKPNILIGGGAPPAGFPYGAQETLYGARRVGHLPPEDVQYGASVKKSDKARLLVLDLTGVLVPRESLLAAELCKEHRPHLVSRGMEALKKYGGGAMSATQLIDGCAHMIYGLTKDQVRAGARKIEPVAGAREFISAVRERGFVPAIITSDLQEAAEKVADDLGIPQELAVGNVGIYKNGAHAGAFRTPYVADEGKTAEAMRLKETAGAAAVVAVGDDWTNQHLFDGSDFSIAYNAPRELRARARVDGGFEELLAALD